MQKAEGYVVQGFISVFCVCFFVLSPFRAFVITVFSSLLLHPTAQPNTQHRRSRVPVPVWCWPGAGTQKNTLSSQPDACSQLASAGVNLCVTLLSIYANQSQLTLIFSHILTTKPFDLNTGSPLHHSPVGAGLVSARLGNRWRFRVPTRGTPTHRILNPFPL